MRSGPHFSLLLVLTFIAAVCLGLISVAKFLQVKTIVDNNDLLNPQNAVRLAVEKYLRYFRVEQPVESMDSSFANMMSLHADIYHTKFARHSGFPEEELWEEQFYAGEPPTEEAAEKREREALIRKLDDLIRAAHVVLPKQGSLAFESFAGHYGTLTKSIAKSKGQICKHIEGEDYETFDHRRRMLFILGTQKAGTTFLFNALSQSEYFVGAMHTYGQELSPTDWPKEVHFFNRFPQPKSPRREFMKSYPKDTWLLDKTSEEKANYTLMDATPDYMFNAMAPPRVKIMFPQAKFVVLLRDPVARALSEYKMARAIFCKKHHNPTHSNVKCAFPSFAEVVASELSLRDSTPGCKFNTPGGSKVWPDCFKCSFTALDSNACDPDDGSPAPEPCSAPPYTIFDVGNYAAQLSWWLSFFPPERFKFITAKELHSKDPFKQAAVLNSIAEFTQLSKWASFTDRDVVNVTGHDGPHDATKMSQADRKALLALRLTYRQSLLDLATLMRHNRIPFNGVPEEFPLASLKADLPQDILDAVAAKQKKGTLFQRDAAKPAAAAGANPKPLKDGPKPGTPEYTNMKLDEIIAHYRATPPSAQKYAFSQSPYGSLSRKSAEFMCPEIYDEAPYPVLSDKRKVLYILGTQKGGTTFLFSALSAHPNFVGAEHGFRQPHTEWAKEVHFFNRWPTPKNPRTSYMSCFPKETWMLGSNYSDYTLVDGTPDYMFNAMAAPRIKEMVPQAKFVVLLRDPVTRAYSAYKMSQKMECRMQNRTNPDLPCKFPSFAEVVVAESSARRSRNCLFDSPGVGKNWGECFRCFFSHLSPAHCPKGAEDDGSLPAPCTAPSFITLDVGNYAAQLSWWFSFFPPERFLILLSSELQHPDVDVRVSVLNKIKHFAQVPGAPFNKSALEGARDFAGGYDLKKVHADDLKALLALRLIYRQSLMDLRLMLWKDGRHQDFLGIAEELTAAGLEARIKEQMALDKLADKNETTAASSGTDTSAAGQIRTTAAVSTPNTTAVGQIRTAAASGNANATAAGQNRTAAAVGGTNTTVAGQSQTAAAVSGANVTAAVPTRPATAAGGTNATVAPAANTTATQST